MLQQWHCVFALSIQLLSLPFSVMMAFRAKLEHEEERVYPKKTRSRI